MEQIALFRPQTANELDLTVEVCFATKTRVLREDENGPYYEELNIDHESVDLSCLNQGAPLLSGHRSGSLSDQIGVVERSWIEDGECRALIRFSKRPDVQHIFSDVANGIRRSISFGYKITETKTELREGDDYPTKVATQWKPFEISIVCIPADHNASVRSHPTVNVKESLELLERHGLTIKEANTILGRAKNNDEVKRMILDNLETKNVKFHTRIESGLDEKDHINVVLKRP